jgi:hypothetical protein
MRSFNAIAVRGTVVAVTALATTSAGATTAQRTFVASTGSDANPCSITLPCRGFTRAITQTSVGGEIVVLESAGYGPVTITKSVSIIAPRGVYAGITVTSGDGVTINAPGATVVLRGLSINGQGGNNGILLQQATRAHVESCEISNMGAVGIYHTAPDAELTVIDTISRDNADGIGLVAGSGASILLDRVHSEHNKNGGFYIAPTPGSTDVSASIVDSVFSYNGANGIWVDTVGSAVTRAYVERSLMSSNALAGFTATSGVGNAEVTLARNAFASNGNSAIDIESPTGNVLAFIAENVVQGTSIGGSTYISGAGANAYVSGNTTNNLACVSGATVSSYGNNATIYTTGCVTTIGTK